MTRETSVNGRSGRIGMNGGRVRYESNGDVLDRNFSIAEVGGCYSVLIGGRVIRVVPSVVPNVGPDDSVSFVTGGRTLAVEIFDPRDLRARQDHAAAHASQQVRASMPGKVVRVLVSIGDAVAEGQGLVVVEAMKMQNEMKSLVAGRVSEVRAQTGATVKAGEVLVVIE